MVEIKISVWKLIRIIQIKEHVQQRFIDTSKISIVNVDENDDYVDVDEEDISVDFRSLIHYDVLRMFDSNSDDDIVNDIPKKISVSSVVLYQLNYRNFKNVSTIGSCVNS